MEQLFGSKTRVKLLQLFVTNPNRPFYVREITRKIDEQINSVRRELANLLNIGILKSKNEENDNKLYYEINQSFTHYEALRAMFADASKPVSTTKRGGSAEDVSLKHQLKELGAVDMLVLTGSFTQDTRPGVDVIIVGDVNRTKVSKYITALEEEEGRELNFVVMSTEEYSYRRTINDRFIGMLESAKKTVLYDTKNFLSEEPVPAEAGTKKGK